MSEALFAIAAPAYAQRGIHVFPVLPGGKTPLTEHGFKDASCDPEQIEKWAKQYPDANIGIATGASNLVVLDVDPRNGGLESMKKLADEIPVLRDTLMSRTGSGGFHLYMNARATMTIGCSTEKLDPGLDIKAEGGYVIAPPSIHPNGTPYEWTDLTKVRIEVPLELVAKLQVDKWKPSVKVGDGRVSAGRYMHLFRLACFLRNRGFGEAAILQALTTTNEEQCDPPKEQETVEHIARSVAKFEPSDAMEAYNAEQTRNKGNSKKADTGRKKLDLIQFSKVMEEDIDWLWYGRIAYRKFQLLVGMPGKTKTYLACAIAGHVTTGRPLPDDPLNLNPPPISVLILTYEDGHGDTLKPRLRKCGADMDRVYTLDMEEDMFTVADLPALKQALIDNPDIRLVVIDPVQNMMVGADGNNDESVRQALNPLLQIAGQLKVAVLGIKHLNKDEKSSIDNRVGGSIGYAGMARNILLAGLDNEKPRGPNGEAYAGVFPTKGNLYGQPAGIAYEVNNHGLTFHGIDRGLTPERLLPKKKKDED